MLAEERVKLEQHLGRVLSRPEELILHELVSVLLARPANSTEATKRATSVTKLVAQLYPIKPELSPADAFHRELDDIASGIDATRAPKQCAE